MSAWDAHITQILAQLPTSPGVYQHLDGEGRIIYIGKAKNLKKRVSSYFQKDQINTKTRHLVQQIRDIKYVVVQSEQDAFLLENNLIKQYQPKYNILLKDGKSYPCICITKEEYPRIFKTRKIDRKNGEYYGPYSYGNTVDLVLELIHSLYPIRTCSLPIHSESIEQNKYKVCLKYHIHNCCGICAGEESKEIYQQYIAKARKIIMGGAHEIAQDIEGQMKALAAQMKFEQAQVMKENLELLEKFCSKTIIVNSNIKDLDVFGYEEDEDKVFINMLHIHQGSIIKGQTIEYHRKLDETKEMMLSYGILELRNQLESQTKDILVPFLPDEISENIHYHIPTSGDKKKLMDLSMRNVHQYRTDVNKQQDKLNPDQKAMRVLEKLQQQCGLEKIPILIDSFDNSHIQGSHAVGVCVVYEKAKPKKSEYKRYSLHSCHGADDGANMREMVYRRYRDLIDEQKPMPDLIIADGGVEQMKAIDEIIRGELGLNIPIIGLKKDDKHRTNTLLVGKEAAEVKLKVTDELFRLLVSIQDEVHRFAISYHKNKRSKAQVKSELDDIQGVGPKTKEKLLQHFGSVEQLRMAEKDELVKIVANHLVSIIYNHFHG